MKSKANVKGHPLHPILIVFPIAFFFGTLVVDTIAAVRESEFLWQMGKYLGLAGIGSAILAAVPGIIDYIHTVPPESSAKQRAGKHAVLNSLALTLYVLAAIFRNNTGFFYIIIAEGAGVALMSVAGWLGGTLVHRNQIGVDLRYADAGKWKEERFKQSNGTIAIADEDELGVNQMKLLKVGSRRIVLARKESGYVAYDDRCPHKGGSLAGGAMMCGTVQCPWHGSQFNVEDGTVKAGPAKEKIATYQVWTQDRKVYLMI